MWNIAKLLAFIIAVVIYVWLIILAFGMLKFSDGSWRNYGIATFFVGAVAFIGQLVSISYSTNSN
jgi:hypothetical protein